MGIKSDLLKTVVKKKKAAKTEYEKANAIAQRNAIPMIGTGAAVAGGSLYTPEENQAQAGWINKGGKQVLETWHGTPHEFPPTANNPLGEYDLSKIGTGEGAQAYGYGIYQADVKDVAKGYQEGLTKSISIDGKPIVSGGRFTGTTGNSDIDDLVFANNGNIDLAIKDVETILKEDGGIGYIDETYKPLLSELKRLKDQDLVKTGSGGSLYKTHSDIQPSEMLDWDSPLKGKRKKQFEEVLYEKFGGAKTYEQGLKFDEVNKEFQRRAKNNVGSAYRYLAEQIGSDAVLSDSLHKKGIKGIQYDDGLSRGTGGGTKNYVIFDPSKMNIVEKGATTAQGVGTLAALSGGAAAIYDAAKNDKLGEATNYAQDAANMVGYIPSGGLLTTSDIIGGVAKAGAAATGNLDAYNEDLAPYIESAGETKSGLGKAVEGVIGYGVEQATPYVAQAAAPIVENVQGQWQRIEDTPGDANVTGFMQELKRKADTKLFQSQAQIDAYNAKRNARRSRKQTK